jgi:hypothetical protein
VALNPVDETMGRQIQVCVRWFQGTVRGYYNNMTLVQCVRKIKLKKMWLRKGKVESQGKSVPVALAFHRRDRFTVSNTTQYYLSVGFGDPSGFDPSGQEKDPDVQTIAGAVADAIKAECVAFDTIMSQNGHHDQLYIAYHVELELNNTRLEPVFTHAEQQNWIDTESSIPRGLGKDGKTIVWPDLMARKLKLF